MSAAIETKTAILSGVPVELNIGLADSRSSRVRMAPYQRLNIITSMLSQTMEPGYSSTMVLAEGSDDEDTVVVSGTFNCMADNSLLLWEYIERLGQDCIAIRYENCGFTFGPRSCLWPYDDSLFKRFPKPAEVPND